MERDAAQQSQDPLPIGPGSRALIQAGIWLTKATRMEEARGYAWEVATHALFYGISFAVYYPEEARALLAQENLFGPEGHEVMARDLGAKIKEALEKRRG